MISINDLQPAGYYLTQYYNGELFTLYFNGWFNMLTQKRTALNIVNRISQIQQSSPAQEFVSIVRAVL